MTRCIRTLTAIVLLAFSNTLWADVYSENPTTTTDTAEDATAKYLKTLGDYLGYDLTQDVSPTGYAMLDYTLNVVAATSTGQNLLYALLRATPINSTFTS